jgi:hypothetical protein
MADNIIEMPAPMLCKFFSEAIAEFLNARGAYEYVIKDKLFSPPIWRLFVS